MQDKILVTRSSMPELNEYVEHLKEYYDVKYIVDIDKIC